MRRVISIPNPASPARQCLIMFGPAGLKVIDTETSNFLADMNGHTKFVSDLRTCIQIILKYV